MTTTAMLAEQKFDGGNQKKQRALLHEPIRTRRHITQNGAGACRQHLTRAPTRAAREPLRLIVAVTIISLLHEDIVIIESIVHD